MDELSEIFDNLEGGGGGSAELSEFFGSYQLLEPLGEGGAARVFRARHVHPQYADQAFAIKILHDNLAETGAMRSLFKNEGYFLSLLNHPNIVHTHEAGIEAGHPFIAMELVEGVDLGTIVDRLGETGSRLTEPLALHIVREVLTGLAFAHGITDADGQPIGIVHRDVNPANVFLSFDGEVKLGDFGVAVTAGQKIPAELAAGTPGHAAPEQLSTGALNQSADVYACGILMYGLLCGRWPFAGRDHDETFKLNRRGRFPEPTRVNPGLSADLESILVRALERKPRKRYPDAVAMLAELDTAVPQRVGMPLVVRSMLRTFFFGDYVRALQMRAALCGQSGLRVSVCSDDATLTDMFRQRGVTVMELHAEPLEHTPVLIDIRGQSPPEERPTGPIVVLATSVTDEVIDLAHSLHAADLVTEPFDPDRLHAAVWSALYATHPDREARLSRGAPCTRVLLVSNDAGLCNRARELESEGFFTAVVGSTEDAVHYLEQGSARIAMLDPEAAGAARDFAERVRAIPGIDLLPLLVLGEVGGVERAVSLPRDAGGRALADTLGRLLDGEPGRRRSFSRYRVSLPATLTYGGRSYRGTATDLSRGGAMLECNGMLPVGATVAMSLQFDDDEVQMRGHILRVAPGEGDVAKVGVRISSMSHEAEARLVDQIARLA